MGPLPEYNIYCTRSASVSGFKSTSVATIQGRKQSLYGTARYLRSMVETAEPRGMRRTGETGEWPSTLSNKWQRTGQHELIDHFATVSASHPAVSGTSAGVSIYAQYSVKPFGVNRIL